MIVLIFDLLFVYYSFEYEEYAMKGFQGRFKSFSNTDHVILKKYFNDLKKDLNENLLF